MKVFPLTCPRAHITSRHVTVSDLILIVRTPSWIRHPAASPAEVCSVDNTENAFRGLCVSPIKHCLHSMNKIYVIVFVCVAALSVTKETLNCAVFKRDSARRRGGDVCGDLTEVQGEVDGVRVLDARQHGLALPPSGVLLVVVVGQVHGAVVVPGVPGVADVAGLGDPGGAGLHAVLLGRRAAGVGRHHGHVKSGVHKLRHAALRRAPLVRTFIHGSADTHRQHPAPGDQSPDQTRHFFSPLRPCLDQKNGARLRHKLSHNLSKVYGKCPVPHRFPNKQLQAPKHAAADRLGSRPRSQLVSRLSCLLCEGLSSGLSSLCPPPCTNSSRKRRDSRLHPVRYCAGLRRRGHSGHFRVRRSPVKPS